LQQKQQESSHPQQTHNPELELIHECGLLTVAPRVPSGSFFVDLVQSTVQSAQLYNIPIEHLNVHELRDRFPQLRYQDDMVGVYEPGAGFVRPERVLQAAQADFLSHPTVTVREHTRVLDIRSIPEGHVEVHFQRNGESETEVIVTRKLLLSAGAWAATLLPPRWKQHLTVTRQLQSWIDVSSLPERDLYQAGTFPAWIMETPEWPIPVYGLPCDPYATDGSSGWIKFSSHGRNDIVRDPLHNAPTTSAHEQQELRDIARVSFSAFSNIPSPSTLADTVPCMYTMTPDSHYLIGSPMPHVFVVAGLSGHGFKMTPALGQMMADFALERDLAPWQLEFYAPDRFER
jgi:glycine/D-amino acid oxidase-like deaminating enzyme